MTETVTVAADDVRAVIAGLAIAGGMLGASGPLIPNFTSALEAAGRMASASVTSMPEDPVNAPEEGAIALHEMMLTFERAGFEHSEAFALVMAQVQAAATGRALRGGNG